jgi:hypothetical protein
MAPPSSTVFGVDFSGGARAGRKIWLAEGRVSTGGLHILQVQPCSELPGSGPLREVCLPALRTLIASRPDATFGVDAPFGLHADLVAEPDWPSFVRAFGRRHPTAEHFRAACREATGGRERWRRTDKEARVPFTGYNLRVFRQTFHFLRDVVAPLLEDDQVRVRPMQAPAPGRATLVEICPASTLKAEGLYRTYKAESAAHAEARRGMLSAVASRFGVTFETPQLVERVVADPEGDALDAVLAAVATAKALTAPDADLGDYHLEGYVYV